MLAQDAETAMAALEDTENVVAQRYIAKVPAPARIFSKAHYDFESLNIVVLFEAIGMVAL